MTDREETVLPSGMSLSSGLLLNDRYELVSKLGSGGMARVWRARHRHGRFDLALKFVDPNFRRMGENEFRLLTQLYHPNIVRTMDMGPVTKRSDAQPLNTQFFLTMALVDGVTLSELVAEPEQSYTAEDALAWLRQLVDVLTYLHESRVIHRDIKPGNIMVDRSLLEPKAVLIDFNISDIADPYAGTPAYKCPHVEADGRWTDFADVWALAVSFWELLTRTELFENAASLDVPLDAKPLPGTPKSLEEALRRIIRSEVGDRDRLNPMTYPDLFGLPRPQRFLRELPTHLASAWDISSKNEVAVVLHMLNQAARGKTRSRSALARGTLKAKGLPAAKTMVSRLEQCFYSLKSKGVVEYRGSASPKKVALSDAFLQAASVAGL